MVFAVERRFSIDFLNHAIPNDEQWWFGFWEVVRFWDGGGGLSLSLWVGWFSIFITWLISFIFEDVTFVLVKCVLSSGCAWITLSVCISFALLFGFANFVNWRLLSDWMGLGVMDIQVSRRSSFLSKILLTFGRSHGLLLFHSQELHLSNVLMTLFFHLLRHFKSQFHI